MSNLQKSLPSKVLHLLGVCRSIPLLPVSVILWFKLKNSKISIIYETCCLSRAYCLVNKVFICVHILSFRCFSCVQVSDVMIYHVIWKKSGVCVSLYHAEEKLWRWLGNLIQKLMSNEVDQLQSTGGRSEIFNNQSSLYERAGVWKLSFRIWNQCVWHFHRPENLSLILHLKIKHWFTRGICIHGTCKYIFCTCHQIVCISCIYTQSMNVVYGLQWSTCQHCV